MSKTYNAEHYSHVHLVERKHFWFVGRSELITSMITRFVPVPTGRTFLDIGCGTGVMLRLLAQLGFTTTGIDVNARALTYAKHQTTSVLVRSSIFQFNSKKLFDAVGAFDVMEHIHDDTGFIKKCHELLRVGGYVFLTVPAGMHLWSAVDTASGHKRRYTTQSMTTLLKNSGFRVVHMGYWNSLLLPVYSLWRVLVGSNGEDVVQRYLAMPSAWINRLLLFILRLERLIGYRLPFGATLVVVAQKI
ncbi:class I SAM-dependent methyltransferase [Candidatus Woesebacteria bacterium]|nr:class I SAM-dependent methyltransferase [Candidatus Woesebacteria bacterium]